MSFHRSTIPETGTEIPDGVASTLWPDHAGAPGRTAWRRRLVLTVLAVAAFFAAVFVLGPIGLIPFGLLLAFSTGSDEEETGRSVILTPRNVASGCGDVGGSSPGSGWGTPISRRQRSW